VVVHDSSRASTHRPPPPGPAVRPTAAATTTAVRLTARVPVLVHAGLGTVLQPYRDRVRLLDGDDPTRPHVELFDPETPPPPTRLGPAMPRVPRLALTWNLSTANRVLARNQGAMRVLPLSIGVVQLVAAIEEAHRCQPVDVSVQGDGPGRAAALSPRESDVVRGICRGLSNIEIGEELYLSVNSVKTYIRTAYRKLGVVSRSQAVLWGVAHLTCVQVHEVGADCPICRLDAAR